MNTIPLRDYQQKIVQDCQTIMRRGIRKMLICSPTGSGKTALSTHIIKTAANRGHLAYFLAHRIELIEQTRETFNKFGVPHSIIAAKYGYEPNMPSYIGSIDTVRNRLDKLPTPDLVIIDECVHLPSKSWRTIVDAWPDAYRIGLTATPLRLDGTGFTDLFDELILGPSASGLIEDGWLSDYKIYAPQLADIDNLPVRAGDYTSTAASNLLDRQHITGDAIEHYKRLAPGKRAIVFCTSIKHSQNVAEAFNQSGVSARHIDGTTSASERKNAIKQFRDGSVCVLANVNIAIEGLDIPNIEAVIMLRPTQSLALHLQALGRGLRSSEDKDTLIILDHVGNTERLGLPDYPFEWTLEGRGTRHRDKTDVPPIRVCPKCYAVYKPQVVCPYCGAESVLSKREIKQREGELLELDKLRMLEMKLQQSKERKNAGTLEDLIALGRARGYKSPEFWARRVFQGRKTGRK